MIDLTERTIETSPEACIPCLLATRAERNPEATAIAAPGRPALTYGNLWTQVAYVVAKLNAMGIGRNDRVAIVLPNGPEMAVAFLAVAAGATAAPLNPGFRTAEFDFYLSDLNAKALIVQPGMDSLARTVAQARGLPIIELSPMLESAAGLSTFRDCVTMRKSHECQSEPQAKNLTIPVSCESEILRLSPQDDIATQSLKGEKVLPPSRDVFAQPDDVAVVLHTSGTTSRPKRVPLTQRNLCLSAYHVAATLRLTEADRCLNVMPLFHIHGLVGAFLSSLTAGAGVVCTSGFDVDNFFSWLEEFCPTWYTAVHAMHQGVLSRAETSAKILGSSPLRFIRSSSTALPPRVMQQLEEAFRVPVIEAYGMTEAAHQIASNPLPPSQRKPGSVGVAAGPEVAIMDNEGNLLPANQTGEIVIRGASVTAGYENSLAAVPSAFTDGWFRTGDQGYLDADGYLFITGRLKEIINRAGEKISPFEIDQILMDHPDICQAAAFAAPHPSLGEDVAAAVVLRQDGRLTESMIREYLLGRLADFKVPAKVWIVEDIPKGPSGKIQRTKLAEKFAEQLKSDFIPPRTKLEVMVAAIYAEVLDLERVGADGNFFALGGDSLRGMQILSRLRAAFQVNLSIATLFRKVTVAELAEEIAGSTERVDPRVMAEILTEVTSLSDEATEKLLADEPDQDRSAK